MHEAAIVERELSFDLCPEYNAVIVKNRWTHRRCLRQLCASSAKELCAKDFCWKGALIPVGHCKDDRIIE